MRDAISLPRANQLHPKCRDTFKAFIEECENTFGIILRIMLPVYRTIDEQNVLYAQGRTAPGSIVTKAKGGQSFHNYGLAIDLCEMSADDKEVLWNFDMATLDTIAKKYGIEWGGDWQSIKDRPHFQISYGHSWQELLAMQEAGKVDADGYVVI